MLLVVKGLPCMIHCEIFNSMALLNQTHLVPTLYLDKISHRIKSVVGEGALKKKIHCCGWERVSQKKKLLVVKRLPCMIHCEIFNSITLLNHTHWAPTLFSDKIIT